MGYCFVEMTDEATAERCLRKVNGKALPGASPVSALFPKPETDFLLTETPLINKICLLSVANQI